MTISKLTHLGFYLNGAQGTGKYDYITIDDVKEHLGDKTLFLFLEEKLGDDIDTSLLSIEEKNNLNEEWLGLAESIDESRKMCVDNGGLCLLVAYILESIKRTRMTSDSLSN